MTDNPTPKPQTPKADDIHQVFLCPFCDEQLSHSKQMSLHIRTAHEQTPEDELEIIFATNEMSGGWPNAVRDITAWSDRRLKAHDKAKQAELLAVLDWKAVSYSPRQYHSKPKAAEAYHRGYLDHVKTCKKAIIRVYGGETNV